MACRNRKFCLPNRKPPTVDPLLRIHGCVVDCLRCCLLPPAAARENDVAHGTQRGVNTAVHVTHIEVHKFSYSSSIGTLVLLYCCIDIDVDTRCALLKYDIVVQPSGWTHTHVLDRAIIV